MVLESLFYSVNKHEFKLSCPFARLVLAPHYQHVAFEGSGFIKCTNNGLFEFELIVKATNQNWIQEINNFIPHDNVPQYFQLQFTDQAGVHWIGSEWTRPTLQDVFSSYSHNAFGIFGTVESILTTDLEKLGLEHSANDIYQFIIPDSGSMPWQGYTRLTTSTREEDKKSVSVVPRYQSLNIDYISISLEHINDSKHLKAIITTEKNKIPPFIDIKLLESLIFFTGRILNFGVQLRNGPNHQSLRLVAMHKRLKIREYPPIQLSDLSNYDTYWDAFICTLSYLIKTDSVNPLFHPFMETLIPVMEAGSRSAGIHSLTLAVAIESIVENCHRYFKESSDNICNEMNDPSNNNFNKEIEDLKDYINKNISDENFIKRINGAITSIASYKLSATDRLLTLEEIGVVSRKQLNSWKKLRHSSAHGGFSKIQYKNNLDEMFGDVYTLANTLILREVGYQGLITDYGEYFSVK